MNEVLPSYRAVQATAKQVLSRIGDAIHPDATEASVAAISAGWLAELGISETWYYKCPALVLAGSRSCLSISGRDYSPAHEPFGTANLITVDLSPCFGKIWGDCARSFAIEEGGFVVQPSRPEFRRGFEAQHLLHAEMVQFVSNKTTFGDLFEFANDLIASLGFVNLDFRGNLGHSIATSLDDRCYIDANNRRKLNSVPYFTFEPHIREANGKWGFKHENIYYLDDNGKPKEL